MSPAQGPADRPPPGPRRALHSRPTSPPQGTRTSFGVGAGGLSRPGLAHPLERQALDVDLDLAPGDVVAQAGVGRAPELGGNGEARVDEDGEHPRADGHRAHAGVRRRLPKLHDRAP
jgi:hypothetical protein